MASTYDIDSQDFNDVGQFNDYNGWKKIQLTQEEVSNLKYSAQDLVDIEKFYDIPMNNLGLYCITMLYLTFLT